MAPAGHPGPPVGLHPGPRPRLRGLLLDLPVRDVPGVGRCILPWIFLVLAAASVFGGMEAAELQEAVVAAMLALPLGYLVAVLLAFSPAFAGLYFLEPSLVPFFMARYSILVLALSLPVNLGGAVVGQLLRDRFRGGRFPDRLQA